MSGLNFEDLQPDDSWVTPARTVTESDVTQFAAMTGDFNPLHVDHEFAATGPFKRPIAHGLLGLSWVAGLSCNSPQVNTVAFVAIRNWSFLRPVYFGDTIHVESKVAQKGSTGKRAGTVIWTHSVRNQKGKLVQEGVFETLVALSEPAKKTIATDAAP
ncbi:MaoC/PaaZ C-terminal domain-containing protein [Pirellulaceae bacterium]|nr:MaoC/PaaZ C-terminal domain-containing protein [Pirellulaceae bacterium]